MKREVERERLIGALRQVVAACETKRKSNFWHEENVRLLGSLLKVERAAKDALYDLRLDAARG